MPLLSSEAMLSLTLKAREAPLTDNRYNAMRSLLLFFLTTEIRYAIPNADRVKISVFDVLGREIEVLVDGYREAGKYTVTFSNVVIPSGVYFYRLISDRAVITKKMCLLR